MPATGGKVGKTAGASGETGRFFMKIALTAASSQVDTFSRLTLWEIQGEKATCDTKNLPD
jgi:hypothetical protein